jgi:hypothetical protein
MGPNRNPRWEQKRTEGYVIVSRLLALQKRLATPLLVMTPSLPVLARSDLLSMAPRKDHAKSRKSDLPYVTNSLNILLYDVF